MNTAEDISVLIKFSTKREKLLENLKEQIKNSEQTTTNKITNLSTTKWRVWQTFLPQNGEYDKPFYHKMESKSVSST